MTLSPTMSNGDDDDDDLRRQDEFPTAATPTTSRGGGDMSDASSLEGIDEVSDASMGSIWAPPLSSSTPSSSSSLQQAFQQRSSFVCFTDASPSDAL